MHRRGLASGLLVCCSSLLASVTAKPVADLVVPRGLIPSHPRPAPALARPRRDPRSLIRRDANTTFDLGFELSGETLFDGSWDVAGQTVSLSLDCVECRTFGELVVSAAFPDDLGEIVDGFSDFNPFNDASLNVGFQGVGALVDLSLTASSNGQFVIPLFVSQTPLGISGPGFQVGVVFGVDLVIGITAEVTVEGGFEVTIPDSSAFTMPLDPSSDNVGKFDGASTTLLPLTADAPADVTVALRLHVQAGLELPTIPLVDAQALAGAFINIPEITLSEQFTTTPTDGSDCLLPASAEININAAAFVDIGADIGDLELIDFDPTVSTTFFSAAATTCFVTADQGLATATTPAGTAVGTGVVGTGIGGLRAAAAQKTTTACAVPLVTETASAASTFTMTSCAAPVANCPSSLAQVIVMTQPAGATKVRCPLSATAPFGNATAPANGNAIPLTPLAAPVTNTLTIDPTVVAPGVPSITGFAKAAVTAMPVRRLRPPPHLPNKAR
ncbi:hypothetical protein AAE478_009280 [Parahypoxylon ruwenzoriense]